MIFVTSTGAGGKSFSLNIKTGPFQQYTGVKEVTYTRYGRHKSVFYLVSLTKYSALVWPIDDNDKDIKRAASESNARDFEILITFQTENNSIKNDMGQHSKFLRKPHPGKMRQPWIK